MVRVERGPDRHRRRSDQVLTRIDVPVDWRWFSPTRKRALGCFGIGPQGYDPLIHFTCLLIGQWHSKAGTGVKTAVGFDAVLRPRPLCTCARCDDLLPFSQCAGEGRCPR
ncbi:MAG: hypothetical protein GDA36_10565 [Rhodobacteraceae bacterium]|nr:hypothetical protein [Paracoccaceae bacterium]